MHNVKPVKQKTVVFQVMEQLKQMIASGSLKPNDKVPNEYELAEMFGVGRSTIREALKIFQYLGVVELRNPKGTFICESSNVSEEALLWSMLLGKKNMKNLLELRLVFEEQGIWYLLEHYKDNRELLNSTVEKLKLEVVNLEKAIDSMDIDMRIEADYQYHKCLIDVCNNDLFNTLYQTMRSFSYEEIKLAHMDIEDKHVIIAEHNDLIETLLQGNVQKAQESFRKHIRNQDPLFQDK